MSREFPDEQEFREDGPAPEPPPGQPTVLPTPVRMLAVAVLFGGVVGFLLGPVVEGTGRPALHVPWTAPAALALAAAIVAVMARQMHRKVQVAREPVAPERGLYSLVLGKSAALVGAAVAGGYLVFGLSFLSRTEIAAARDRLIFSLLSVLASAGFCAAGWFLERACIVPDDEAKETGGAPDA